MSASPNHVLIIDGSTRQDGSSDPKMLRYKTSIVQKNSGVQMVVNKQHRAWVLAEGFKPRFRKQALELVMAREYGLASLGSEQAATLKELNTTRITQSQVGQNIGPPASPLDKWFHGKKKFQNNPSGKDEPMMNF